MSMSYWPKVRGYSNVHIREGFERRRQKLLWLKISAFENVLRDALTRRAFFSLYQENL